MTVREFLDIHPDADLDLRTPAGRIYLDAAVRRRLESGRPVIADSGSPKTAVYVRGAICWNRWSAPLIRPTACGGCPLQKITASGKRPGTGPSSR